MMLPHAKSFTFFCLTISCQSFFMFHRKPQKDLFSYLPHACYHSYYLGPIGREFPYNYSTFAEHNMLIIYMFFPYVFSSCFLKMRNCGFLQCRLCANAHGVWLVSASVEGSQCKLEILVIHLVKNSPYTLWQIMAIF